MTAPTGTTVHSRHHIEVQFDGPIDPETAGATRWSLTPQGAAVPALVVATEVEAGHQIINLLIEPGLSPGESYDVGMELKDEGGDSVIATLTASVPLENVSERGEWSHDVLRATTRAVAQEIQAYTGVPVTLSTQIWSPGDEVLFVESTYGWPSSGAFHIDSHRFRYDNLDDSGAAFRGVRPDEHIGVSLPDQEAVICDRAAIPVGEGETASQIEQAWRDTLVTKAEGDALDRLADFYDFSRPDRFKAEAWRRALHAIVYGARGTLGCTFSALEGIYSGDVQTFEVSLDPAAPGQVAFVSGPAGVTSFDCAHVGRFVRLRFLPAAELPLDPLLAEEDWPWEERVFYTIGPDFTKSATSSVLLLAPYDSGYWTGANWERGPWRIDPAYTSATMDVLPFTVREPTPGPIEDEDGPTGETSEGTPCLFELLVDGQLFTVPPTYLLEPGGVDRDTIDADMPTGGHIMDEFDLDGSDPAPPPDGDQDTGPYPIYLASEQAQSVARLLEVLLAAGVRATETLYDWCAEG